jgi:hypothetical protein
MIVNALKGHFVALGTNVIGARTTESILQLFPKKLTKALKAEFYGQVCSYIYIYLHSYVCRSIYANILLMLFVEICCCVV